MTVEASASLFSELWIQRICWQTHFLFYFWVLCVYNFLNGSPMHMRSLIFRISPNRDYKAHLSWLEVSATCILLGKLRISESVRRCVFIDALVGVYRVISVHLSE